MPAMRIVKANVSGKCNPTSTKGRSRWKSSSENYLLIAEVRFRVRFRVMVRDSKTIFHENYFWWMSNCVFQHFKHRPFIREKHDKGSTLETLDFTIHIGSTQSFLYFDVLLFNTVLHIKTILPAITRDSKFKLL